MNNSKIIPKPKNVELENKLVKRNIRNNYRVRDNEDESDFDSINNLKMTPRWNQANVTFDNDTESKINTEAVTLPPST